MFASLDQDRFRTNEGRRADQTDLYALIAGVTQKYRSAKVTSALTEATVPHSLITPID